MRISLKTTIPTMAIGTLFTLSACSDTSPLAITKNYMRDTNRTQLEFSKLTDDLPNNIKGATILQSRLDSMAYRDLFNTTQAAKNPSNVAEFNKIAAKYRADFNDSISEYNYGNAKLLNKPINSLINKLKKSNISIKDFDEIERYMRPNEFFYKYPVVSAQHYTDKWAYKKFFEKIGIFNGEMPKNFEKISQKIKLL